MNRTHTLAALMIAGATFITGCASTSPQASSYNTVPAASAGYGTIDSIQITRAAGGGTSGLGAVAGGLVGALAGNQIGSGGGRTAATLAGAVGGAVVGNKVEANRDQGQDAYQISVRMDNGDYRTVVQDNINNLGVGKRVRVVDGRVYLYQQ